jgi:hypothetical protein
VEKDWLDGELPSSASLFCFSLFFSPGNIEEIKDTLFPLVLSAEIGSSKTIVSRSARELYDDVNEVTILILTSIFISRWTVAEIKARPACRRAF